ncbi:unnamed protein product [Adineta ricciae]|uniref:Uncharacterized protein n=1 Tax=Adineta ricciae TaxID=249248 RepID=A0A816ABE0_ADIRI|nr:unnamed protein product [Adineta ricciae]CAF1595239.1 unnamed protein product [Adineta ricciae]
MSSTANWKTTTDHQDTPLLNFQDVLLLLVLIVICLLVFFLFLTFCLKQRHRNRIGLQSYPPIHQQTEYTIDSSELPPPPYNWHQPSPPPPPYYTSK